MTADRELVKRLWWAGIRAVRGEEAVRAALTKAPIEMPDAIVSVGKAAASMAKAAVSAFGPEVPCLVLTKYDHASQASLPDHVEVIESAHPVPDDQSLRAGQRLLQVVSRMEKDAHLLLLVSGGASALVEVPVDGWDLDKLAAENARLLAAGLDIHAMNERRRALSRIKGGRLLSEFSGRRVTTFAISDVEGDDLDVIGSGIGAAPETHKFLHDARIVASNAIARAAVAEAAAAEGLTVLASDEVLYADITEAADRIAGTLDGTPGLSIFGGEPTTVLPENPGEGGRNQALALTLAGRVASRSGLTALVAGTDGSDGPTTAAGGMVDGGTWGAGAADSLRRADSGTYLVGRDDLFVSGPTGTNVMDLALVLQR
ncbi:MAG: DUF4147 domain-containing protein [Pseudomonadota bacterium]